MSAIANKWDNIYSQQQSEDAVPSTVLYENAHLLPSHGEGLDLACGMGGNAIFLASKKLQVQAWDVSTTALNKLKQYSELMNLSIKVSERDVENNPPDKNIFDVVAVSQFLHRATFNNLCGSLKIGGLLFYQTFTLEKTQNVGPSNPDFLLTKNELLNLCNEMEVLVYREEGVQGDSLKGWRNQAMIVAKRIK